MSTGNKPTQSVQVGSSAPQGLVSSIDITRQDERYTLCFRYGTELAATLTMSAVELRQWLAILHGMYVRAEWPRQVWPSWIERPADLSMAGLQ